MEEHSVRQRINAKALGYKETGVTFIRVKEEVLDEVRDRLCSNLPLNTACHNKGTLNILDR